MKQVTVNLDELNEHQLAVLANLVADAKSRYAVEHALFSLIGRREGALLIEAAMPVELDSLQVEP